MHEKFYNLGASHVVSAMAIPSILRCICEIKFLLFQNMSLCNSLKSCYNSTERTNASELLLQLHPVTLQLGQMLGYVIHCLLLLSLCLIFFDVFYST